MPANRGVVRDFQLSRSDSRTAGYVDGELGVTYSKETANSMSMVFTFGYRFENWFDVNNTRSEVPSVAGNLYGSMYADQTFHGPFLRGEIRFK